MTSNGSISLINSFRYYSFTPIVAVVAVMISAALGFGIGPADIIGAMGAARMSVLAAACTGGTVYLELHMYTAPFTQPQYRYAWTFTASDAKYDPFYLRNAIYEKNF